MAPTPGSTETTISSAVSRSAASITGSALFAASPSDGEKDDGEDDRDGELATAHG